MLVHFCSLEIGILRIFDQRLSHMNLFFAMAILASFGVGLGSIWLMTFLACLSNFLRLDFDRVVHLQVSLEISRTLVLPDLFIYFLKIGNFCLIMFLLLPALRELSKFF